VGWWWPHRLFADSGEHGVKDGPQERKGVEESQHRGPVPRQEAEGVPGVVALRAAREVLVRSAPQELAIWLRGGMPVNGQMPGCDFNTGTTGTGPPPAAPPAGTPVAPPAAPPVAPPVALVTFSIPVVRFPRRPPRLAKGSCGTACCAWASTRGSARAERARALPALGYFASRGLPSCCWDGSLLLLPLLRD